MGRKSSYSTTSCNYNIAEGCRRVANVKTMREPNMCMPCYQKKHAKRMNQTRNVWTFEGSKKRLMRLPIREWPSD